jgi:RND family efflux transporter MFP subunit
VKSLEQLVELDTIDLKLQQANLAASIEQKQNQLEKMTLTSPIAGIVSRVNSFAGDLIGGGAQIAEIISLTRIVEAKISEENFARVRVDQDATVRLAGYGDQKFDARVAKLLPTADAETQRYVVQLEVKIEDTSKLVPGLTGEALITVNERPNALLVPRPALIGGKVFVVKDGVAHLREVKVGYTGLNDAEILEGVDEGDLVVVDNLDMMRDGRHVRAQAAH